MARKRKTISVEQLKDEVSRRNKESTCDPQVREGWNALLEEVLHSTGNYRGFGYWNLKVNKNDVPYVPDETRRFYY